MVFIGYDERHPSLRIEARDSYDLHMKQSSITDVDDDNKSGYSRRLHHHHNKKKKKKNHSALAALQKKKNKRDAKRKKKLQDLFCNPGIQTDSTHGMMIDAGSSGSRMHVYEFHSRVLRGKKEITEVVSGRKLSYPDTNSRWTERLRPGIASFASLPDDQLFEAVAEYLKPMIKFAETILHEKNQSFPEYPVYLKGTAGLRTLDSTNRVRVLTACRDFFMNESYSKFKFEKEYARVISGEEEAVYGWTGANFALGSLLTSSEGSGTVMNPTFTYGTLEMGGASAQIAFYRSNEDIMSNLFKLQIGQGKHWNVYAHSYLYYGIHESWNRMGALLASNAQSEIQNPCLPGGSKINFESSIYFIDGHESLKMDANGNPKSYKVQLQNGESAGNYEECSSIASSLLNKRYNTWCEFSHQGDCSFSGVYQPELPELSKSSGEFLAFSNFYDIFDFLEIPDRSSLITLENATMNLCSLNERQLVNFNNGRIEDEEALKMCFQATFAFEMLRGFGFSMDDNITAANVVNGQKLGWALGSMLYEINTLPWQYLPKRWHEDFYEGDGFSVAAYYGVMVCCVLLGVLYIFLSRPSAGFEHKRKGYTSINDVQMVES